MNMIVHRMILFLFTLMLSACAFHEATSSDAETPRIIEIEALSHETPVGVPVGGAIATAMNPQDKDKLNHALDKAIGTQTIWMNGRRDVVYTVTPVRKVTISGNTLCRDYEIKSVRNQAQTSMHGTACVAADGAWS